MDENKLTPEQYLKEFFGTSYHMLREGEKYNYIVLISEYAAHQSAEKDERIKELEAKYNTSCEQRDNADGWATSLTEDLEAVKKERDDMQALCTEVHNEMIDTREERDALKKKLETAVKLLEDYRYMARNDHDMAHLDMEADGFFASLQTTGQDVSPNMDAIDLIAKERKRQITVEGWTPAHDDRHDCEELAQAAACYAYPPQRAYPHRLEDWPFAAEWFKEGPNRMRELVKAGALIVAEIERLHRAQTSTSETTAKEADDQ